MNMDRQYCTKPWYTPLCIGSCHQLRITRQFESICSSHASKEREEETKGPKLELDAVNHVSVANVHAVLEAMGTAKDKRGRGRPKKHETAEEAADAAKEGKSQG